MKTEQPAAAGVTFNSMKEVEANQKTRMEKAITDLQHEMASIRTGRASLGILDHIRVDYYGTPTPLNQVANLHVPEPVADHHPAVGRFADRADRKGHPNFRPGPEPIQRRKDHPPADSAADRRAPQGAGEEAARAPPSTIAFRCATSGATATKPSRSC